MTKFVFEDWPKWKVILIQRSMFCSEKKSSFLWQDANDLIAFSFSLSRFLSPLLLFLFNGPSLSPPFLFDIHNRLYKPLIFLPIQTKGWSPNKLSLFYASSLSLSLSLSHNHTAKQTHTHIHSHTLFYNLDLQKLMIW